MTTDSLLLSEVINTYLGTKMISVLIGGEYTKCLTNILHNKQNSYQKHTQTLRGSQEKFDGTSVETKAWFTLQATYPDC